MGTTRRMLCLLTVVSLGCSLLAPALADGPDEELAGSTDRLSYAMGMQIAESLKQSGINLNLDALIRGLTARYTGETTLLSDDDVAAVHRQFMAEMEEQQKRDREDNLHRSRAFLDENRRRDGVHVTDSGLQYEVLEQGDGQRPGPGATVEVHYVGRTIDGVVFDSSHQRGEPAMFPLGGIISGLAEGIQLMQQGASYRFFLPPELAYGERGAGQIIEPNLALQFDIELIGMEED